MHRKKHEAYLYHVTFNAMHNLVLDNPKKMHAHTFCVGIYVIAEQEDHPVFLSSEKILDEYFEQYQGIRLNELPHFIEVVPTLENMGEVFYADLKSIFAKNGMQLVFLEVGDSPISTYYIGERLLIGSSLNMMDEEKVSEYCKRVRRRYWTEPVGETRWQGQS